MGLAGDVIDYRLLFRGAPTAFVVLDPELVIVEASDAYLAATARTRAELVGRPVFEAFPDNPTDPEAGGPAAWRASLHRVLRERVTDTMPIQRYDIPSVGGGFDTRYWAPVNAPMFGPGGELRYIVHRTEDVTEYVQARRDEDAPDDLWARTEQMESEVFARQRLQEQNRTLQTVVDSVDAVVVGCDPDGRPVLYNEPARALVGDRLEGLPAEGWGERLHLYTPEGCPMVGTDSPLMRVLRGEWVHGAEVIMRPPGAPRQVFRLHGRPVTGLPGLATVVTMHDVTVHRRVARFKECELEVSRIVARPGPVEDVLSQAMECVGSMTGWAAAEFWAVDDVAQVLRRTSGWVEPGREPLSDLPDPLLYGQALPGRAWQTKDAEWETSTQQAAGESLSRAALAIPVPSGSLVLGVIVCYSDTEEIPDDVRTAIQTGIAAHIGEMLERQRAERLAAELDRTRDEYIALVGHELRTPLTSIEAYAHFLLDEPDLPAEHQRMLHVMQRNATSLHTIVTKLLDVAGMRAGHLTLRPGPLDLTAVVHEAIDGITVDTAAVEVNAAPRVEIEGDAERLRQVVDELLTNALTWTDDDATVGVQVRADDRTAVLTVSNAGERISVEEHARLFEMFFRGRSAHHRGLPGAGLGLTLARVIVELHGGTLTAGQPEDPVTTMTVRLPVRQSPVPSVPR
ncbi:ATP-binding protein [Catenuloplanes sp. NPDC051500]|uniref:ATP-binding protein n=1 Tax=Catenuloplanes sp. NPDC051500 TaxID=3363959 RepID=UPI00378E6DD4